MVKSKSNQLEPGAIPKAYIKLLTDGVVFTKVDTKETIKKFLAEGNPLYSYQTETLKYSTLHRAYVRIKECHVRFCKAKLLIEKMENKKS